MKFRFTLYDSQDGGYFVFAPIIYQFNTTRLSFALELFGRRFFYTEIRRK